MLCAVTVQEPAEGKETVKVKPPLLSVCAPPSGTTVPSGPVSQKERASLGLKPLPAKTVEAPTATGVGAAAAHVGNASMSASAKPQARRANRPDNCRSGMIFLPLLQIAAHP